MCVRELMSCPKHPMRGSRLVEQTNFCRCIPTYPSKQLAKIEGLASGDLLLCPWLYTGDRSTGSEKNYLILYRDSTVEDTFTISSQIVNWQSRRLRCPEDTELWYAMKEFEANITGFKDVLRIARLGDGSRLSWAEEPYFIWKKKRILISTFSNGSSNHRTQRFDPLSIYIVPFGLHLRQAISRPFPESGLWGWVRKP